MKLLILLHIIIIVSGTTSQHKNLRNAIKSRISGGEETGDYVEYMVLVIAWSSNMSARVSNCGG